MIDSNFKRAELFDNDVISMVHKKTKPEKSKLFKLRDVKHF